MRKTSIALVDAHPVTLEGIAHFLAKSDHLRVVGVASRLEDALALVDQGLDVLVLDISVPQKCLTTIQSIASTSATKIVVFTANESPELAVEALKAGAHAYVLKRSALSEVADAIDSALRGNTYISPEFAARVIAASNTQAHASRLAPKNPLSYREEQIVKMLLRGNNNREIAAALGLSEKTIKSYMTALMQKLNARSRLEVVMVMQQRQEAKRVDPQSRSYA